MRILGIDPGSRLTGYGCIDLAGSQLRHVSHGTLKLMDAAVSGELPFEERLLALHHLLSEVILEHRPQVVAIEKVFFAKNAVSALKLGQARGAAILTAMIHSLSIVEYSVTEVKQALVGHGRADKSQVAKMVQVLIGAREFETWDASDGLALAICHAHRSMGAASLGRGGAQSSSRPSRSSKGLADSLKHLWQPKLKKDSSP